MAGRNAGARLAMSVLTLASLALGPLAADTSGLSVLPGAAVWVLALGMVWTLYGRLMRLKRWQAQPGLWALAGLFAAVVTLGQSFQADGTAQWATDHAAQALVMLLGRALLFYAGMRLALEALTAAPRAPRRRGTAWMGPGLFMCWLPWYACLFPGTVSNDSHTQLRQIFGLDPVNNAHPVFQTWLIDLFRRLSDALGLGADGAVALYCVVQAALMAWLLGALLRRMWLEGAPAWLRWGSLAFFALCPIFPVFAFCMGKDTNFAMATLFLAYAVQRAQTLGKPGLGMTLRLALAAVLCLLLRNAGVYLAAVTLGLLLAWTLRRARRKAKLWAMPLGALGALGCAYLTLHLAVLPSLSIAPMPHSEEYSLPLQQVARTVASHDLTPEEARAIDGALALDGLKEAYNGELSDPVKALWREDATPQQKSAFWRMWVRLGLKHPLTYLSATFHNTYGYLYPGYLILIKPNLIVGDQSSRTAQVEGLFAYTVNPASAGVKALDDALLAHTLGRVLLCPGLYGWVTLFAFACLLKRGARGLAVCASPALLTLAGLLLSAVNGYFRYAMPLYFSAPLLMWLVWRSRKAKV